MNAPTLRMVEAISERAAAGEPIWRICSDYVMPVDIKDIADRLGVQKDTVNKWRFRGLLPDPTWQLAMGPVWEWFAIYEWAKRTGRL